MKKGAIVVSDFYKNNRLFDLSDKIANRDDSLYPAYLLREYFKKAGVELTTQDVHPIAEYDFLIFQDFPLEGNSVLLKADKRKYLIISETGLIAPQNWKKENHIYFEKIFTWNDGWVDNIKYIKYCWPNKIPDNFEFNISNNRKLCCLISGNKVKAGLNELYSERQRAVRWFEKHHPEDFDLFGTGWDSYPISESIISKAVRRYSLLNRILAPKYPSYRGKIESKKEVLSKYKFTVCYENVKDTPGYITEKIFDCFFAGSVPIYLGAQNITDFVPESAFINRRKYKTYNELYNCIKSMNSAEYKSHIDSIRSYLKSEKVKLFSAENFVMTIVNNILEIKQRA